VPPARLYPTATMAWLGMLVKPRVVVHRALRGKHTGHQGGYTKRQPQLRPSNALLALESCRPSLAQQPGPVSGAQGW